MEHLAHPKNNMHEKPKILLVDDSTERLQSMKTTLNECGYLEVFAMSAQGVILDEVRGVNPDIILVDVESPSRDTLEQLTLVRKEEPRPVVLFTQDQNVQSIHAAIESGVSAYLLDGISPERVRPAIEIAMATFKSFQKLRKELDQARTSLHEQKTINQAKAILMKKRQLNENDAYHFLRKLAMGRKQKISEVAHDIIALKDIIG
jgi:response regulator NasT